MQPHNSWTSTMESRRERLYRLFDTDEPVVWITGSAANRVGRQIAKHFFALGYRVVLHARSSIQEGEEGVRALNSQRANSAMLVQGDVGDEAFSKQAMTTIAETFGRLDVLVNSAAIWDPVGIDDVTKSELLRNFEANTIGSFLCAQQASQLMRQQSKGGAVINVGDWASDRPYTGFSAYFPSKAAIPGVTKCLAVELAQQNHSIRVNAILPGPVMIPDEMTTEARQALMRQCLLQREGNASDVAEAALFLAEAPFITGAILHVDGGRILFGSTSSDATAHPSIWN